MVPVLVRLHSSSFLYKSLNITMTSSKMEGIQKADSYSEKIKDHTLYMLG